MDALPPPDDDPTARRLASLVDVASAHGATLTSRELLSLLPEGAPVDVQDLATFLRAHPAVARLEGGTVVPAGRPAPPHRSTEERRHRGDEYRDRAMEVAGGPLASARPWMIALAITGSTAYREPEPGDDLDLMAIVRPGTLWLVLAFSFLRLRFGRGARPPNGSSWCLNYALDARRAAQEFESNRGALFAREALTARVLVGDESYSAVLARARWMAREYPRLYASRVGDVGEAPTAARPADVVTRVLNVLLFPVVATYLHLKGLRENARLRRTSDPRNRSFRTITEWDRFALHSDRFRALGEQYDAAATRRESVPTA